MNNKELQTILIVEEDISLRDTVRKKLEEHNYILLEATTGGRAIEILERHHADLIIIGMHLPDGKCLDFITPLKGIWVYLLLLSAKIMIPPWLLKA